MPPPAQLDQLGGLVEVAAEQAFVAGGLLEQERAAVAVFERRGDHLRGALHRRPQRLAFLRAGVEDDAGGADPSPIRSAWVSEASDFLRSSLSLLAQLIR